MGLTLEELEEIRKRVEKGEDIFGYTYGLSLNSREPLNTYLKGTRFIKKAVRPRP